MSARINIPVIVNPLLLQHIQICMSGPRNINVFQWNGECSFFRHTVDIEVPCDDDRWSHLGSTKNRHGLQRHLLVLRVETLPIRLKVPRRNLHSLRSVPDLEWVRGIRSLSLTTLLYHLLLGIYNILSFVASILLSRWFFEDKILMLPTFSKFSRSAIRISPFPNSPRD